MKINTPAKSALVKIAFSTALCYCFATGAHAQTLGATNDIFTAVEHQAEFKGGYKAFEHFADTAMRYPSEARAHKVQGKVIATFVVEKDGSLTQIKVLRGIGSGCDEEAIRILQLSPKWNPPVQNNFYVRQQYTVVIPFVLHK